MILAILKNIKTNNYFNNLKYLKLFRVIKLKFKKSLIQNLLNLLLILIH